MSYSNINVEYEQNKLNFTKIILMKGMRLLPLLVVVVMLMAVMTIHWQVLVSNLKTKSCFRNKVVQILNF
jgi:hypothetical protein